MPVVYVLECTQLDHARLSRSESTDKPTAALAGAWLPRFVGGMRTRYGCFDLWLYAGYATVADFGPRSAGARLHQRARELTSDTEPRLLRFSEPHPVPAGPLPAGPPSGAVYVVAALGALKLGMNHSVPPDTEAHFRQRYGTCYREGRVWLFPCRSADAASTERALLLATGADALSGELRRADGLERALTAASTASGSPRPAPVRFRQPRAPEPGPRGPLVRDVWRWPHAGTAPKPTERLDELTGGAASSEAGQRALTLMEVLGLAHARLLDEFAVFADPEVRLGAERRISEAVATGLLRRVTGDLEPSCLDVFRELRSELRAHVGRRLRFRRPGYDGEWAVRLPRSWEAHYGREWDPQREANEQLV